MNTIRTILFDYGAVIFDIDHSLTIRAFTDLGVQGDAAFFGHLQQNPVFDRFEKGEISAGEFRDRIRELVMNPLSDDQIDLAWNKMLLGIRPQNLQALELAKKHFRTFLLSNNNEIHYAWIMDYLKKEFRIEGMASYFEKDYYSHLMGMRKPDEEIFLYVLRTYGLDPAETLFIDDSPQHIRTADALGIRTHLMKKEDNLMELIENLIAENRLS